MFGLLMRHIARPLAIMLSAKSGPGQKHAFKDAVAQMGCPDRRVDRLSHYMQLPFPNLLAPIEPARTQLCCKRNWFAIAFAAYHHRPDHSYNLIGQCNGRDLDRSPCHELSQPWTARVSQLFDTLDDGECAKHQQRSLIPIASFGDATQSIFAARRILFGNQTDPSRHLSARTECLWIGNAGN